VAGHNLIGCTIFTNRNWKENQVKLDAAVHESAMRNATFFLLAGILDALAASKGEEREHFLQQMRRKTIEHLDAERVQAPAAEHDAATAEAAALARAIVGATFDVASAS
jgi:ribonuclease HIII